MPNRHNYIVLKELMNKDYFMGLIIGRWYSGIGKLLHRSIIINNNTLLLIGIKSTENLKYSIFLLKSTVCTFQLTLIKMQFVLYPKSKSKSYII